MNHSAEATLVRTGFQFLEGPVWLEPGSALLEAARNEAGGLIFSDIPTSRLYCLIAGEATIVREPSGEANGNALDHRGALLSCEHRNRRVSRFDGVDDVASVVERYNGKRLNSPNDVAVRSDGMIFFTDPPYGVDAVDRELGFQGVFCVEPGSADPKLLADDFVKPNGLAFSRDEQTIFIADTERGHLRRFAVAADGSLTDDDVFCSCERPDGICVDVAGRVWVACMKGVELFDADGSRAAFVALPERPANLAFGDVDLATVYVCARTSLYAVRSDFAGVLGG
jgi:gluconolactonase